MAFLSNLVGLLGGPQNILGSVGKFASDFVENVSSGKGVGESLGSALSGGIKKLVGINEPKEVAMSKPVLTNLTTNAANLTPMIVPNTALNDMARQRAITTALKPRAYNEVLRTTGGFPEQEYVAVPPKWQDVYMKQYSHINPRNSILAGTEGYLPQERAPRRRKKKKYTYKKNYNYRQLQYNE